MMDPTRGTVGAGPTPADTTRCDKWLRPHCQQPAPAKSPSAAGATLLTLLTGTRRQGNPREECMSVNIEAERSGQTSAGGAMDGQVCDRHPSAAAKARVLFPNLGTLYLCGHCAKTLPLAGDYHITYETVTV